MKQEINSSPENKTLKTTVLGYAAAIAVSFSVVMIISSSQVLGSRIPPFQSNFIRFTIQTLVSSLLIVFQKKDPRISHKKSIAVLCVSSVANFCAGVLFIISAWYLPAAVVDGLLENVIIILASIASVFLKECNIILPLAVVCSIVGNLLLFQPPLIFPQNDQDHAISSLNKDVSNTYSTALNSSVISWCNESDYSDIPLYNCTDITPQKSSYKKADNSDSLLGFVYAAALGFCFWIHQQLGMPYLINHTTVNVVFFWISISCFFPSLLLALCTEKFVITSDVTVIGLVTLLCCSQVSSVYFVMIAVVSISATHTALVLPSAVVILFVFQNTILHNIQPGKGNWMEVAGLIMIITAALSPAVYDIVNHKLKERKDKDNERIPLYTDGK